MDHARSRFVDQILIAHKKYCIAYRDDILVYAMDEEICRSRTASVVRTLEKEMVNINFHKSQFVEQDVIFSRLSVNLLSRIMDAATIQT